LNFLVGSNSIKGYIIICSGNMNKIHNLHSDKIIIVNRKLILQLNYLVGSNLIRELTSNLSE
jgi:hypothetical protein